MMMITMFVIMVNSHVSLQMRNHPSGRPFFELSDHEDDFDVGDQDGFCYRCPPQNANLFYSMVIGQGGVSSYEKSPKWPAILGAWIKISQQFSLSRSYLTQT